jgi:dTDP-4-amino-4,6-dideoxygalactose transaminase
MKIKFNDFKKEYAANKKEYLDATSRVFDSGWYILGKEVKSFEEQFAKYLGVKYCIGVANGLEALQIAMMSLDLGRGDEVITTPVSAVATTLAILAVGATPVFVDTDENGQIDSSKIEKAITTRTKAVLPVHLYGQPCKIDEIKDLCKKHKLYLIEDAAQAHGSTYKAKKLGTFGDVGCFSFYPTKNLGAIGDGGAIVTNDSKIAKACAEIRDYGQKTKYVHTRYGLNSRLDELQAALLSVKLKYLDGDNVARRSLAKRYIENLKGVKGLEIILPERPDDSNYHLFVIRVKNRDGLQKYLTDKGIPTLIHYPIAIPDQPLFAKKYDSLEIPEARGFVKEILSLPCHPFLNNDEVDYISEKIIHFFKM